MTSAKRVLVVDDEASARHALGELLSDAGYEVDTACDGEEALADLDRFVPDVVLTDLLMPKMGGEELIMRLRKRAPDLPVVVMTAHDARHTGVDIYHRGALGYLTKPVNFEELLVVLEGVLAPQEHDIDATPAEAE